MTIPKTGLPERMAYMAFRATIFGLTIYTCYRVAKIPVSFVKSKFFWRKTANNSTLGKRKKNKENIH
jgi:hypothetical protein